MANKVVVEVRIRADAGPAEKPRALPVDRPSLPASFCQEELPGL